MANKRFTKIFVLTALSSIFVFSVSGCANSKDTIVLRLLNMEDYIYLHNPKDGYDDENLYDGQFKKYLNENYPEFKGKNIDVVYDTTDTNETLYSKLQTGKSNYDLICTSDYMVQKLMAEDKIVKLDSNLVPNYYGVDGQNGFASKYLLEILKNINATTYKTKEKRIMNDYSVGYMWGTLGFVFNPTYAEFQKEGLNPIDDFSDWSSLWDKKYKGTFTIKNSVRDTYAIGVMETFKDEFLVLKDKYEKGEITAVEYTYELSEIFNRSDDTNARKVFDNLYPLKDNAFGFEVDSGKQDIVTKKIGGQISWSGDAVYSMQQAADRFQVSEPFELNYSIPLTGSNVWFDAWAMPNIERSEEQYKLAHAFLNFISNPVYAGKNMDYTGYSSFIGGAEVRDYLLDCFDARTDQIYYIDDKQPDKDYYYSIFYQDPDAKNELTEAKYKDCAFSEEQDPRFNNVPLKYYKGEFEIDEEGKYIDSSSKQEITFDSPKMISLGENYNARFEIKKDWDVIDLSYIFEDTIEGGELKDYLFYCENYFVKEGNNAVGGTFFAQYPDANTMARSAVMKDYRENNGIILKLWEEFKSNSLPTWAIVLFAVEGVLIVALIAFLVSRKIIKKNIRKNRRKQQLAK